MTFAAPGNGGATATGRATIAGPVGAFTVTSRGAGYNTPPTVTIGSVHADGGRTIIAFDVRDDHSPIQRVEFSQDGLRWQSVFPVDGISDSLSEHCESLSTGYQAPTNCSTSTSAPK